MPEPTTTPSTTPRNHDPRWLRTERILLVLALGVLLWLAGDVLLLVFAGLLMAVGLDGLACAIARRSSLSRLWALALVLLLTLASMVGLALYMATPLLEQFEALWGKTIEFTDAGIRWLGQFGWAQQFIGDDADSGQLADAAGTVVDHVAKTTMLVLGAVSSLAILVAIALFATVNPQLYRGGLLKLFPHPLRERMDRALGATAHALRWWFLGQLVSMLLLGVTVSLGLWIIGVDVWLGLGVLTALLTFIPYIGPLIAAVPVLIVGFTGGPQMGFTVLVFYLIVQNIEGTIIVPLIQQRAVHAAPALMISVQVLMGALFGIMGLILAAPLTVVAMVMVNKLYVEDVLGEQTAS